MILKEVLFKKLIGGSFYFLKKKGFSRKISRIYRGLKDRISYPSPDLIQKHKLLWAPFKGSVNIKWLAIYAGLSGIESHKYVPEDIYYTEIEPRLNNKGLSKTYTDKNLYDKILPENYLPLTLVRGINGFLFNKNYEGITREEAIHILNDSRQFIIKPSIESGGGRKVKLLRSINGEFFEDEEKEGISIDDLIKMYMPDFICQELIINHSFYSRFNKSSLNTVRFLVYTSVTDGNPNILNCVLRVGKPGFIVDNQASGGFACGITHDGLFNGKVVNKHGDTFVSVNDVIVEKGTELYKYQNLKEMTLIISPKIWYSHLIGLDLCVDKDGNTKIIEVNCYNNEINFFQMTNGPLFGNFTEDPYEAQ